MNRKVYIKENLLQKILSFFSGNRSLSASDKEKIDSSDNAELKKLYNAWMTDSLSLLYAARKIKKKYGKDTSEIDRLIKKTKAEIN